MQARHGERGAALVIALMLLMALAFVGAALIFTAGGDLKVAGADRRGTQAEFVAEAGVQEAMHRLALEPGTDVTVNGETFDAAIRDTSDAPDPNWEVRIFAPDGSDPTSAGSLAYTPTVQSADSSMDYMRDGAYLSIRHKWRDRNGDGIRDADEVVLFDPSKLPPENFDTGSPVEVIQVAGHRASARRRLEVETARFPFSPNVMAALNCNTIVDLRGTVNVCGHNHRADTPENTHLETNPPCSPNYDEPSGHLSAVMTTGDEVLTNGSTDLLGEPSASDTTSSNPFYSLAEALGVTQDIVDYLLAHADYHSAHDANPLDGITYINGNATGGNKFVDIHGSGLLYVSGDLEMAGNSAWRGLIYVDGDFKITGNPWILGAVLVRGKSQTNPGFGGGTPTILFSEAMIRISLEMAFDYVVLSWKEL
jgi:hypothetical protein